MFPSNHEAAIRFATQMMLMDKILLATGMLPTVVMILAIVTMLAAGMRSMVGMPLAAGMLPTVVMIFAIVTLLATGMLLVAMIAEPHSSSGSDYRSEKLAFALPGSGIRLFPPKRCLSL